MMRAGTLPLRKPGTWMCSPMALKAASRLGLSSSKGTSTVILTRVGLRVSSALFTAGTPLTLDGGAGWLTGAEDPAAGALARRHGAPTHHASRPHAIG